MSTVSRLKVSWQAIVSTLVLAPWLAVAAPGNDEPMRFDIAAQPIVPALKEFLAQTRMQLLYRHDDVKGITSNAVVGHFGKREALQQLLKGTGLDLVFTTENGATIKLKPEAAPSAGVKNPQEGAAQVAMALGMQTVEQGESASEAQAQEQRSLGAEAADKVQEIVVTAQKREERLQDVPISVSVLSGEQLDSSRASGLLEALATVPGVTIKESLQGSTTALSIRGVNATSPLFNGSSPIGFYLDSLPFGFVRSATIPDLNPYDLDRVEILRGPQGTLYGANSLNGVVRVLTKEADFDAFDAKARTSISSTDEGGANYRGDVAINLPIIEGKLAARAVAGYEDRSGWIDTPNRQDVNDATVSNIRLKVGAQPREDLLIGLTSWRSRTHLGAASISNGQDRRSTDDREDNHTNFDTHSLAIDYDRAAFSVSSTTSYLKFSNVSNLSLDGLLPPDFPLFDTDIRAKNFSEELLFSSNTQGKWRWSAGVFYRIAQEDLFQRLSGNDLTYESKSTAFFGQLTRMLLEDRLEITAGLRHFEDRVTYQDNPGVINLAPPFVHSSAKFDKLSPKATISWHANNDTTIYASYGEGFRGGFSQFSTVTRVLAPDFPPVGPDELTNYELGAKGSVADGRLDFEAAVFYVDWRDTQQVVTFRDVDSPAGFPVAINTARIDGIGAEVALKIRPLRGLELGLNYSWNDLAFGTPVFSAGQVLFDEGFRPPESAEKTLGGSVSYSLPMPSGWTGHFNTSANYTSALGTVSLVDGVRSVSTGQSILLARVSFAVETPDHWTLTAYAENLTNSRRYLAYNSAIPEWSYKVRPRTIGLQLEYDF